MTPDLVKIGKVVRATKGTLIIKGIRIYPEKNSAIGSKSEIDDL